jgi:hypothetical protein
VSNNLCDAPTGGSRKFKFRSFFDDIPAIKQSQKKALVPPKSEAGRLTVSNDLHDAPTNQSPLYDKDFIALKARMEKPPVLSKSEAEQRKGSQDIYSIEAPISNCE